MEEGNGEDDGTDEDGDDDNELHGLTTICGKRHAAATLFDSGEFKTRSDFDVCWEYAWSKAQRTSRSTATSMRKKLVAFRNDATLPQIPPRKRGTERKKISVFSFALLRMKVAKYLQKLAEGDRSGLRLSHGPEWAKEVVRLNDYLLQMCDDADANDSGSQSSEGQGTNSPIICSGMVITRLLTGEECDAMKKRAEF